MSGSTDEPVEFPFDLEEIALSLKGSKKFRFLSPPWTEGAVRELARHLTALNNESYRMVPCPDPEYGFQIEAEIASRGRVTVMCAWGEGQGNE